MKNLSTAIANHLTREVTTLATLWKITRTDNLIQGFTNHNKPITIDGITYKANTGFNATAFDQDNTLAVRNLDIDSILSDDGITEADLSGGKYDYATVDVFLVNWADPPASLSLNPPVHIPIVRGILGEVSMSDRTYKAEVRSSAQLLQEKFSNLTTKECRAVFGDGECTKDLTPFTDGLIVIGVTDRRQFTVNSGRADGFYELGQITITSGNNTGIEAIILSYSSGIIELFESLPYSLRVGDTLTAIAGCDKTISDCKSYDNILNYRGEPHIPGGDEYLAGFQG